MKFLVGFALFIASLGANATFITFDESDLTGHGMQASNGWGGYSVTNGGLGLAISGNYWVSLSSIDIATLNNSVLSFEFMTTNVGEVNGIGFDNDSEIKTGGLVFDFGGTQGYGNQDFAQTLVSGVWYTITIDFTNYDISSYDRMLFVADQDVQGRNTDSNFRNLFVSTPSSLVEVSAPSSLAMFVLALTGLGFRARRNK